MEDISKFVEARARSINYPVFGKISYPVKSQAVNPKGVRTRLPPRNGPTSFAIQVDEGEQRNRTRSSLAEASVQTETKATSCPCCGSNHKVAECPTFIQKPLEQRVELAKRHGLCFACLKGGHQCKNCFRKRPRKECTGKHSTLLHVKREPGQENLGKNSPDVALKKGESKRDQEKVRCSFTTTEGSVTALPIVPVKIRRKGTKEYVET